MHMRAAAAVQLTDVLQQAHQASVLSQRGTLLRGEPRQLSLRHRQAHEHRGGDDDGGVVDVQAGLALPCRRAVAGRGGIIYEHAQRGERASRLLPSLLLVWRGS